MKSLWVAKQKADNLSEALLFYLEKWGLPMESLNVMEPVAPEWAPEWGSQTSSSSGRPRQPVPLVQLLKKHSYNAKEWASHSVGAEQDHCLAKEAVCNNIYYDYCCCFYLGSQTRMHFWICYTEKLKNASHRQSSKKLYLNSSFYILLQKASGWPWSLWDSCWASFSRL